MNAWGAGWEIREDQGIARQAAWSTVTGAGPQGPATASLVLTHWRGHPLRVVKKKTETSVPIGIYLCADDAQSLKGFDLDACEGPEAPASFRELVQLSIVAGGDRFRRTFRPSGWFSQLAWLIEPGAFGTGSSPNDPLDFVIGVGVGDGREVKSYEAIVPLLQRSPTTIEVIVTDSKDPNSTLRFSFPTDNLSEVVGRL